VCIATEVAATATDTTPMLGPYTPVTPTHHLMYDENGDALTACAAQEQLAKAWHQRKL